MSVQLTWNQYGKARVRLVKVERHPDRHDLYDLNVQIAFSGDYEDCYATGSNARVLPTDTMKNTVYALASQGPLSSPEAFALRLADHFLGRNPDLAEVRISIDQQLWTRLNDHAFEKHGPEVRTCVVESDRSGPRVSAGLRDLVLLKTTHSEFTGYIRDEYTTLRETTDRILATSVTASWHYAPPSLDFDRTFLETRAAIVAAFAAHHSLSVQHTLHAMGEAALARVPEIEEITFSLPNKHCIPVDLTPFGLDNRNEIFLPIDEPHGLIEGTLRRQLPPA